MTENHDHTGSRREKGIMRTLAVTMAAILFSPMLAQAASVCIVDTSKRYVECDGSDRDTINRTDTSVTLRAVSGRGYRIVTTASRGGSWPVYTFVYNAPQAESDGSICILRTTNRWVECDGRDDITIQRDELSTTLRELVNRGYRIVSHELNGFQKYTLQR